MRDRSMAARSCLVAALCAVVGVPGLHALLHEVEEEGHEHEHEHHDQAGDDHDHDQGEHHHHQHGHDDGPLHGQGAPEHLQLALTEAPPPPIAPLPEIEEADQPIGLVDRLLAHDLEPTRSIRGPPLKTQVPTCPSNIFRRFSWSLDSGQGEVRARSARRPSPRWYS